MLLIILEHSFTLLALVNSVLACIFVFIIMCTVHLLFTAEVRAFNDAEHTDHLMTLDILVLEHFLATLVRVVALNGQTHEFTHQKRVSIEQNEIVAHFNRTESTI